MSEQTTDMSGDTFSVKGKMFLITGAASGLGACFAQKFLKEGAKHIAIVDVSAEAGEKTTEKLRAEFGAEKVSFFVCDVTDENVLTATFKKVVKRLGNIDVLINNAGILDDSPRMYRRAIDIDWQALVTLSVLAWEHMRRDKGGAGGTIVNVASHAALMQYPPLPIYSGCKAAVLHFSSCLGMEENFNRTGVRVLSISFGATRTAILEGVKTKCMDDVMGNSLHELVKTRKLQSVESAAAAMATAVERGASGSAWFAARDEPVRDITPHLRAAYAEIAKAFPGDIVTS